MLGGDVFILEPVGFFVGKINNALHARRDKYLSRATTEDIGFGASTQGGIEPFGQCLRADT